MLILNPRTVKFGSAAWENVTAVMIDRKADRLVADRGDDGPHVVLADVPEERVTIRVMQEVLRDDPDTPRLRTQEELVFFTSPAGGDAGRRRVSAAAVVVGVEHELSRTKGAVRTITLIAVSADGAADPVTVSATGDARE